MKGEVLYEEVWECRLPRRQTLEEELLTLQALAPDMIEDLHSLFKEAVTDSLANILGWDEARALVKLLAETEFESPSVVFAALDSFLHEGSQILKDAIVKEFRANVHLLLEKVKRSLYANHERASSHNRPQERHVPRLDGNKILLPKLRIPSDPRRVSRACEKGLHKIPLSSGGGTAHEWEASKEELAFWNGLARTHKDALVERQYDGCFLCNLDLEMP